MSMIGNFLRIAPSQLAELREEPESIEALLEAAGEEADNPRHLDVDKAWHIIHFLLTGDAWGGQQPVASAICGGTELGDVDVGCGPARYLTPQQVHEVAAAVSGISASELWSRFDAEATSRAEIYPADSWTDDDADYVQDYFEKLKDFYTAAAQKGEAVLLYIN